MHLSTPIYALKRRAKSLARQEGIPLHRALDRVAVAEGFRSWSHLAADAVRFSPAAAVLDTLAPGELVLLGARPGHGKTLLGLELAARAHRRGRTGFFFTLDDTAQGVACRLSELGLAPGSDTASIVVDTSDEICADHIVARIARANRPVLAVVDYLQLLDQRRTAPILAAQVATLRAAVKRSGAICVVISQIDRAFEMSGRTMPDLSDVRLPNPLDVAVFDRACFLNDGKLRIKSAA